MALSNVLLVALVVAAVLSLPALLATVFAFGPGINISWITGYVLPVIAMALFVDFGIQIARVISNHSVEDVRRALIAVTAGVCLLSLQRIQEGIGPILAQHEFDQAVAQHEQMRLRLEEIQERIFMVHDLIGAANPEVRDQVLQNVTEAVLSDIPGLEVGGRSVPAWRVAQVHRAQDKTVDGDSAIFPIEIIPHDSAMRTAQVPFELKHVSGR